MKCPVCESVELAITERERVEIDYCPRCRGVWLDRGELDKVTERYDQGSRRDRDGDREGDSDREDDRSGGRRRSRAAFLGDLFDVG